MSLKERLVKRLPKHLVPRVEEFTYEEDLRFGCNYLLVFSEGYHWRGDTSLPCGTFEEAKTYIRESEAFNDTKNGNSRDRTRVSEQSIKCASL